MTWQTTKTTGDKLDALIAEIRRRGGKIASCHQCDGGLLVTWFTL